MAIHGAHRGDGDRQQRSGFGDVQHIVVPGGADHGDHDHRVQPHEQRRPRVVPAQHPADSDAASRMVVLGTIPAKIRRILLDMAG